MAAMVWFLLVGICKAQSFEFSLDAGSKSIHASADYRKNMDNGYLETGISGLFTDDDDIEYKWGVLKISAGNDTLVQGLRCEIGLKGIFGSAEDAPRSGDVGALAFAIHAGYTFPKTILPIPIEIFSDLTYAPDPLSFQDTKAFTELRIGLGVHIINNASLYINYAAYSVDMKNGPGDWTLDEGVIRAGVAMRF